MQQQTFYYLAYGSNMYTNRLQVRCPNAEPVRVVYVEGKRLTFNKVSTDGSGKCHIEDTGSNADRVYGVLFRIPNNEKAALDDAEGLGNGYIEDTVRTLSDAGEEEATVYLATDTNADYIPYHWYKGFVLRGANDHHLPAASIALIQAQASQPDLNDARRTRNEALLNRIGAI